MRVLFQPSAPPIPSPSSFPYSGRFGTDRGWAAAAVELEGERKKDPGILCLIGSE